MKKKYNKKFEWKIRFSEISGQQFFSAIFSSIRHSYVESVSFQTIHSLALNVCLSKSYLDQQKSTELFSIFVYFFFLLIGI